VQLRVLNTVIDLDVRFPDSQGARSALIRKFLVGAIVNNIARRRASCKA
jgi:hypothetical protein